ncbi:MAG TPA: TIGR02679 family protein [Jatrophihabitans sp.]|nr:TIGR02679 family protein [Jatrophihabitans sp.]
MTDLLGHPDLAPLWRAIAARLEGNGLSPSGYVKADLSEEAADRLSGLVGATVTPGSATRIGLGQLDAAFRRSRAALGLVPAIATLTGAPLLDRRAARQQRQDERAQMWAQIDSLLADAGLAAAAWVPRWQSALRQSGILTRAGAGAALAEARIAVAALALLAGTVPALLPDSSGQVDSAGAIQIWGIGQLAAAVSGDAHGLDDNRLASALALKALAAATGTAAPTTAAERRAMWFSVGVSPDSVSGTTIVHGLRPPGDDPWSQMMRCRADLGLVTHLTLLELAGLPDEVALAPSNCAVWVCENPQVLQAAALSNTGATVVCLLGNPSSAGSMLIRRLVDRGATPAYHGDFDWPGVAIAGRMIGAGCIPWRMSADDYRTALTTDAARLPLSGEPVNTGWDPELSRLMAATNVAVHEEALLPFLLADLPPRSTSGSGGQ